MSALLQWQQLHQQSFLSDVVKHFQHYDSIRNLSDTVFNCLLFSELNKKTPTLGVEAISTFDALSELHR
jgi:hypothetical protein